MNNLTTTNQKSLSQASKKKTFSMYMSDDAVRKQVNNIVGGENGQRFMTAIISAVSTNPALAECTHATILSSALLGESLKLSPSPQLGQYYMIPFKKKAKLDEPETTVATFVLGYKGYIQLAIRSGYYKKLNVLPIKEGELTNYDPLTEEITVNIIDDDEERENAKTIGYYAMFEYTNGFRKAMYWSKKKMLKHANKFSKAFKAEDLEKLEAGQVAEKDMWRYSSFWYQDFDGMACKTMLRQLISKWGIMSIDMQKAFDADEQVINTDLSPNFVESAEDNQVIEKEQITQPAQNLMAKNDISSEMFDDDPLNV